MPARAGHSIEFSSIKNHKVHQTACKTALGRGCARKSGAVGGDSGTRKSCYAYWKGLGGQFLTVLQAII